MIPKTFESGNYNNLDTFVKKTLPNKLAFIRGVLIPKIDETLDNMLGARSDIKKVSIDANALCTNNKITSIRCSLVYNVDDFNVPTAPAQAIKDDTDSISKSIQIEGVELKSISIDVYSGDLKIIVNVPLE